MLHLLSLIVGIAATLLVFWLRRATPRKRHSSARQKQLLPPTNDHKRFHEGIQGQQMSPEDLEIGPLVGQGSFGQVYRGWSPTPSPYAAPERDHHLSVGATDPQCFVRCPRISSSCRMHACCQPSLVAACGGQDTQDVCTATSKPAVHQQSTLRLYRAVEGD